MFLVHFPPSCSIHASLLPGPSSRTVFTCLHHGTIGVGKSRNAFICESRVEHIDVDSKKDGSDDEESKGKLRSDSRPFPPPTVELEPKMAISPSLS